MPNIPHTYMPHSHDTSNNAYLLRPNGVLQRKMILLMSAGEKKLKTQRHQHLRGQIAGDKIGLQAVAHSHL